MYNYTCLCIVQRKKAKDKVKDRVENVKESVEEALEEAQDQIEEGADEVKKALDEAGDEIEKPKKTGIEVTGKLSKYSHSKEQNPINLETLWKD